MTVETVEEAIYNILHAIYGEEVRDSIAEALRLMNNKSQADKEDAEAYAVGKRNGVDVASDDPTYHNNSKWYSEQAASSATAANTAKNQAVAAKTAAESARDAAIAAKDTAVAAKDDTVSMHDEIAATIATVNAKESVWDSKADGNHVHPGYEKVLIFTNKTIATSAWASSSTYSGYSFQAAITCSGVTVNHYADVIFAPADATSANFAPVAVTSANTVTVYAKAKPSATITIPTIKCESVVS